MTRVLPPALPGLVRAAVRSRPRGLVAVAGAPASGKSTLAEELTRALGSEAALVPMDGYHLDNAELDRLGLRSRKGAPETFDAAAFARLLSAVALGGAHSYPRFDRARDATVPGAGQLPSDARIIVVEGNYLLLDDPAWRPLHALWHLKIFLDVPERELERRLLARWRRYGFSPEAAREKALGNDIPNARTVARRSIAPDLRITPDGTITKG